MAVPAVSWRAPGTPTIRKLDPWRRDLLAWAARHVAPTSWKNTPVAMRCSSAASRGRRASGPARTGRSAKPVQRVAVYRSTSTATRATASSIKEYQPVERDRPANPPLPQYKAQPDNARAPHRRAHLAGGRRADLPRSAAPKPARAAGRHGSRLREERGVAGVRAEVAFVDQVAILQPLAKVSQHFAPHRAQGAAR